MMTVCDPRNEENEKWMRRAFALALQGRGSTSPNPMVGAIIVKNNRVVGEGFHRQAGGSHAEIAALQAAGENARDAVLYVNLEPCSHQGRTPPCAEALVRAGIKKVVAAMPDPNPEVNRNGIQLLRKSGVSVEVGFLEEEARILNEVFVKWISTRFPFFVLKSAMSLDGKIADAERKSKWITGEPARKLAREMRSWHDAILVGVNTVLQDDPLLTCRVPGKKNPIRIILDSAMKTPENARVIKTAREVPTWIVASQKNAEKESIFSAAGVKVFRYPGKDGRVDLRALGRFLGEREITSVMVEGGAKVHGSFLRERLADKVLFFVAPKLFGESGLNVAQGLEENSLENAVSFKNLKISSVGEDFLVEGYPRYQG